MWFLPTLYIFPSHFLFFIYIYIYIYLSLSHSLSLSWNEHAQEARAIKRTRTEASNHYKSTYPWASLALPQHKHRKSDFFFFFFLSLEQKVSKVNLMFLGHYGCLRLHHFILEKTFSKSKLFFLNLKQDISFLFIYLFFLG